MNYSEEVKSEILKTEYDSACCKRAALSAFLRSAGSIITDGGRIGFEIATDSDELAAYFAKIISELYGKAPRAVKGEDKLNRKNRIILRYSDSDVIDILVDLGIIEIDDRGPAIKLNIDWYILENDCCKVAYVKGMFLGSGSVTLPKSEIGSSTGYHLEFVFTNYQTATDFCEILSEIYFLPKLVERKGNFVVYLKSSDEISDLLATMGASNAVLKLAEITVEKEVSNNENRRLNCEVSNLNKQTVAAVKQIVAARKIEEILGLDNIDLKLKETAKARIESKGMTMSELAAHLGVTKSCLNHRLRKIVEIADNL
ncbi:MAG: DNA-binding protein WhiA [Clostridia bacterium]|nr:DNA-binding protein WhiA [Clostridia bacterium]